MSHAGVKRMSISYLTPNSLDFLVVGVIIAKRQPRRFSSKRDNSERGVWSFTLRDSPADYINVTAWGGPQCIEQLSITYKVGDVIDLTNPRVLVRKPGEKEELFQPAVTSSLELVYNEGISGICLHDTDDSLDFIRLLHLPAKPHHNFLNLSDVKAHGKLLSGQYVNLLVAVQKVGDVRTVRGKDGSELHVIEIAVMDKTASGFTLHSWDLDTIQRAQCWQPRNTVLFVSDVKVEWNSYRKMISGAIGTRSIVTENPNTREAAAIAHYALTAPIQSLYVIDALANNMPHPDSIVNVMSCNSVLNHAKMWTSENNCNNDSFTALVYATVHQMDLDGCQQVVITKCSGCGSSIAGGVICTTEDCPSLTLTALPSKSYLAPSFDIRLSLIDHTAKLASCRLTGSSAVKLLGYSAEEFSTLSQDEKTSLKWKFLLKKVAAKLVIMLNGGPTLSRFPPLNSSPLISVVALQLVSLTEYSTRVPLY